MHCWTLNIHRYLDFNRSRDMKYELTHKSFGVMLWVIGAWVVFAALFFLWQLAGN